MSSLPRSLRPWSTFLGQLDPELADAIGPWLPRLSAALGRWNPSRSDEHGEPDGIGGIGRRGSFDRLVASQWALADAVPDEFIRRAAQSELVYLTRARRSRRGQAAVVCLLDVGPEQIGAPRLAQLAWLVVFDRRVAELGGRLRWGLVQRPGELFDGASPSLLRRIYIEGGRQVGLRPTRAHAERWTAALGDKARRDVWWVGGSGLTDAQWLPRGGRVTVSEPIDFDDRTLHVIIAPQRRRARPHPIVLPLPEPDECVRLLRDPFRTAFRPSEQVDIQLGESPWLRFSPSGRRLIVGSGGGGVTYLSVPGSPREPAGHHVTVPPRPGHALLAAGWAQRRPVTVWGRGDELTVRWGDAAWFRERPFEAKLPDSPPAPLPLAFGFGRPPQGGVAFRLGSSVYLLRPRAPNESERIIWLSRSTRRVVWFGGGLIIVRGDGDGPWTILHHLMPRGKPEIIYPLALFSDEPPLLGCAPGRPCIAISQPQGNGLATDPETVAWRIVRGVGGDEPLRLHRDASVIGVTTTVNGAGEEASGLVALEADRHGLRFVGHRMNRHLIRSRDRIIATAVASSEATVAALTESGTLTVLSLDHRRPLLRLELDLGHG